jgi:hypothetical protein
MPDLSRRNLVTSAAALPALAVAAGAHELASEPDPVFAAIEKWDALDAELLKICKLEPVDADDRPLFHTPEYDAWEAAQKEPCSERMEARDVILQTAPTTAAGAVAMMKWYVRSQSYAFDEFDYPKHLFDRLTEYLERAAVRS